MSQLAVGVGRNTVWRLTVPQTVLSTTLKDILLRCELNFTDVAAVLVIGVSSVFSATTPVKIYVTAAKADATTVKTVATAVLS